MVCEILDPLFLGWSFEVELFGIKNGLVTGEERQGEREREIKMAITDILLMLSQSEFTSWKIKTKFRLHYSWLEINSIQIVLCWQVPLNFDIIASK